MGAVDKYFLGGSNNLPYYNRSPSALKAMLELGDITQAEYDAIVAERAKQESTIQGAAGKKKALVKKEKK